MASCWSCLFSSAFSFPISFQHNYLQRYFVVIQKYETAAFSTLCICSSSVMCLFYLRHVSVLLASYVCSSRVMCLFFLHHVSVFVLCVCSCIMCLSRHVLFFWCRVSVHVVVSVHLTPSHRAIFPCVSSCLWLLAALIGVLFILVLTRQIP